MGKTGEIIIAYKPEKIAAINAALARKGLSLTEELTKYVDSLYTSNTSNESQFLISAILGEKPPPIKEKKNGEVEPSPASRRAKMKKLDYIIEGADGVTYTVMMHSAIFALLSFETEHGTNFLVVEGLEKDENGTHVCTSARNFGEDCLKALRHIEQSGPRHRGLQEVRI